KDRYYTATEMLEDFVSDAGTFQVLAAAPALTESGFERRLRRALGDDYELLEEIGAGGFGRVYRARDLALEREVAIKVLNPNRTAGCGLRISDSRWRCAVGRGLVARHPAAARRSSPRPSSCWASASTNEPTCIRWPRSPISRYWGDRRSAGRPRNRFWRARLRTMCHHSLPSAAMSRASSKRCCGARCAASLPNGSIPPARFTTP